MTGPGPLVADMTAEQIDRYRRRHRRQKVRARRSPAQRGECFACRQVFALFWDGTVWRHKAGHVTCEGSGTEPARLVSVDRVRAGLEDASEPKRGTAPR